MAKKLNLLNSAYDFGGNNFLGSLFELEPIFNFGSEFEFAPGNFGPADFVPTLDAPSSAAVLGVEDTNDGEAPLLAPPGPLHAPAQIWLEDFESAVGETTGGGGAVTRVAANHASVNGTDGGGNYSFRSAGTPASGTAFAGFQGTSYWAAEDVNDIGGSYTGGNTDQLVWNNIDITGLTTLSFSGLFAAQNNLENGGTDRFENSEFILVEASIDGGAFFNVLAFEDQGTAGDVNTNIFQDTDFDGVGDGAALTHTFTQFTASIAGTGASLNLRITFSLDGANEEIAFDDFEIIGDAGGANDAPVAAALEGAALSYQESGGAQNITAALTLADADDIDLESATISITAGLDMANDSLVFVNQNGITGVYTAATGVLTLTGTTAVAEYQAAIRSITYLNAFNTESTTQRTVSIVVNDGDDDSVAVTRDITFNVNETHAGTGGNDTLFGGFGADVLIGIGGNDRLFGEEGDDTLNGGDGNDQLWGGLGADAMDGGTGTDGAYYILAAAGVTLNTVTGGTGGEAMGDTYTSIERFFGSQFGDTMTGGAGVDTLFGLGGDDMLDGLGGNDLLLGHGGVDTINGGDGDDRIVGGDGNDILFGDAGADNISGSAGDDSLNGGADNDLLRGDAGIDTLNGDAGADRLFGGDGDDIINGGDDNDSLWGDGGADAFDGGAGIDRVLYTTASAGVGVSLANSGGGSGDAAGDTFTSIENIVGSQFADNLSGDANNNIIVGLGGDDILSGAGGNDRLIGGDGADFLIGGDGDDILVGQGGADTYYYLGDTFGADIISGWENGTDIIELEALTNVSDFSDLVFTQVGSSTLISFTEASVTGTIRVTNSVIADFDASDFNFVADAEQPSEDKNSAAEDLGIATELNQDLIAEFMASQPSEAPKYYMNDGVLAITFDGEYQDGPQYFDFG